MLRLSQENSASQDCLAREAVVSPSPPSVCARRWLDVCVAIATLLLLSPLLAVTWLLVKVTSRGPAFYLQERVGRHGARFMMLKFRTMHVDAERTTGPVWAIDHDPRCTWIGGWLRRLSIDELPQLINVLRGEMSVVGPRPERPYFVEQFARKLPHYDSRHEVRPGLTGWAQIQGWRGNTSLAERLRCDLEYVERQSLALDLYILALTPYVVFAGGSVQMPSKPADVQPSSSRITTKQRDAA